MRGLREGLPARCHQHPQGLLRRGRREPLHRLRHLREELSGRGDTQGIEGDGDAELKNVPSPHIYSDYLLYG